MGTRVMSPRYLEEQDQDADVSWLDGDRCESEEDEQADAERLAAFHRGDWHMIGVSLACEIVVAGTVQRIRTPGLWNVESDADASYLRSVAADEHVQLVEILSALGFEPSEVPPLEDFEGLPSLPRAMAAGAR